MSEYVTVEAEPGDAPDTMELYINQRLTEAEAEVYRDPGEGNHGSPIAQMLFAAVDGIAALTIESDRLIVQRERDQPWEAIIDEIRDALRDWFL